MGGWALLFSIEWRRKKLSIFSPWHLTWSTWKNDCVPIYKHIINNTQILNSRSIVRMCNSVTAASIAYVVMLVCILLILSIAYIIHCASHWRERKKSDACQSSLSKRSFHCERVWEYKLFHIFKWSTRTKLKKDFTMLMCCVFWF